MNVSLQHQLYMKFDQKLNSQTQLHKNKASSNLCAQICCYQKKSENSKSLKWGTSKDMVERKRHVKKNKLPHINFHCHEPGLFTSQAYPHLVASPNGVISCNCCCEGILENMFLD